MLYGTVTYELKEGGGSASKDWAGRAELVDGGKGWKLRFYQVYLVSFCIGGVGGFVWRESRVAVAGEQG